MAAFRLSKWYMDCVTDAGAMFVAYAARLDWGVLSLRYGATLVHAGEGDGEARSESTLIGVHEPTCTEGAIEWGCERLRVEGRWASEAPPVRVTVFESAEGKVAWTCHQPRARVRASLSGARLEGLGYAEHVELTLPPWSLPIDELRWGRFIGRDRSLVWVDWRGPHEKRVVALDGVLLDDVRVEDHGVSGEGGRVALSIEETRVLRHGRLGAKALAGLVSGLEERGIRLPLRILQVDERKALGRGVLRANGRTDGGATVHEVVRWPATPRGPGEGA
jgi:hypothetical protein